MHGHLYRETRHISPVFNRRQPRVALCLGVCAAGITLALTLLLVAWPVAQAASPSVAIKPSQKSSQPVGTTIIWTASSSGIKGAVYRFSVHYPDGMAKIVRDFSPSCFLRLDPLARGDV